jgi:hypothetical protein
MTIEFDENNLDGRHMFDWWLGQMGYSPDDRDAIRRGMSVSSFKGEMPHGQKANEKLIAAWLEAGRMQ